MKTLLFLFLLNITIGLNAQILKPVKWSFAAKKISATESVLFFKASMQSGWHIYSIHQAEGGPTKTNFTFIPSSLYQLAEPMTEPKPMTSFDKNFEIDVSAFEDSVVFKQKIKTKAKQLTVKGKIGYMTCNDHQCLPEDEVSFSIPIK